MIREFITTQVTSAVREEILEVFGCVKTTLIKMFYKRYVVVNEVAAATVTVAIVDVGLQGRMCVVSGVQQDEAPGVR